MSSETIEFTVDLVDEGDISVDVSSIYGHEGITPSGSTEITVNGTYDVTNYASAVVDVPQSGITPTGTKSISANGTHDVTQYASANVNVPNSYSQSDEGKVVSSGELVAQTSQTITENGTYDTTLKNSATVSVPNTYSAGDEGKVVSNGALVAQTSDTVTTNDTYDTTLINSLTVNVSGGGGSSPISKLGEVTVSENVRAFNLDLTPYASYDLVIVISDVTLNSTDWLYYVKNGSSPSGGTYGSSAIHHYGLCIGIWLGSSDSRKYNVIPSGGAYGTGYETVSNLYIYTYNSSKYITAGSKFTVYGGNYADM